MWTKIENQNVLIRNTAKHKKTSLTAMTWCASMSALCLCWCCSSTDSLLLDLPPNFSNLDLNSDTLVLAEEDDDDFEGSTAGSAGTCHVSKYRTVHITHLISSHLTSFHWLIDRVKDFKSHSTHFGHAFPGQSLVTYLGKQNQIQQKQSQKYNTFTLTL